MWKMRENNKQKKFALGPGFELKNYSESLPIFSQVHADLSQSNGSSMCGNCSS